MSVGRRTSDRRIATEIVVRMPMICAICSLPIDRRLKWPDPGALTADHIIPISLGGDPTHPANLRPAHFFCNTSRGNGQKPRGGLRRSRDW
jgi:5-methylcytosine-specific restriction endonuclease McrA